MTPIIRKITAVLTLICVFKFALGAVTNPLEGAASPRDTTVREMDAKEENICRDGAELKVDTADWLKMCVNDVKKQFIPIHFDARRKWPNCPSISEIADQGNCLSSWAVALASTLTDRHCIASKGENYFEYSAQDLLTCGAESAKWKPSKQSKEVKGCKGGNVMKALKYLQDYGTVSGSSYRPGNNRGNGCRPYEIAPTGDRQNPPIVTPKCDKKCQPIYTIPYANDTKILKEICSVNPIVEEIQTELMNYGPVVAVMKLWYSFYDYNTAGVYEVMTSKDDGVNTCHAVKIIGWGTDVQNGEEVPYWLVANSWGASWGDNGFFKVVRGAEKEVSAWIETLISTARFH